jgi:two-component system phosphate regulon sensor histidine kinase PhoR
VTLRSKILSTFLVLAIAGIVAVSLLSAWQITGYLGSRSEESLKHHVHFFALLIRDDMIPLDTLVGRDQELRNMAKEADVRLTLIRNDGTVLFDSEVPHDSLVHVENHLHRPEVQAARAGTIGVNRRRSATVSIEFLYAAEMISLRNQGRTDSLYVRAAMRYDEMRLLNNQIQVIIWGIGLLTVAVIVFVSMRASRRITRPILAIADTARAIRDGDLTQRIPVHSHDEIGTLSAAINDMADKLANDISQLKKLEHMRSEFLGNVSHELRTPIFSLQGFLETLLDGAIDDPNVNKEFVGKAYRHAGRLNALLNDLIEISRIESGEMKMSFRYMPLGDFLRETTDEMRTQATAKNQTLKVDSGDSAQDMVYADRDRLKQVMINLLDNAIKYTEPGGTISVRTYRSGEGTAVEVTDTGSGIAPEHLPRIFERFYRVDKDRSREVGGTGLGLAIVKHIVEAHGGTIRVTSSVNKGSTFTFTLRRS